MISKFIKNLWVAGILALALVAGCSTENTPVAEHVAANVATHWLHTIDVDSLDFAYDDVGPVLREQRTRSDWVGNVREARAQLGELIDRQLATRRYEFDPPLHPEGAYVIVSYETDFAKQQDVEELVLMHLIDGIWRPERYIIDPAP